MKVYSRTSGNKSQRLYPAPDIAHPRIDIVTSQLLSDLLVYWKGGLRINGKART